MKKLMRKQVSKNVGAALRKLLQEGSVGTHEDIAKALEKQGFAVNQPKISRLLHKIGAIKVVNQQGQNIYRLPHEHGLMHELNMPSAKTSVRQWILDVVSSKTLIVVHTTPGAGALVAREIDLHQLELGILGTIAGDDTVFIAPKEEGNIKKMVKVIMGLLEVG